MDSGGLRFLRMKPLVNMFACDRCDCTMSELATRVDARRNGMDFMGGMSEDGDGHGCILLPVSLWWVTQGQCRCECSMKWAARTPWSEALNGALP